MSISPADSFSGFPIHELYGDAIPLKLREVPEPPGRLYCRGDLKLLDMSSIAIVGTRKASVYGMSQAHRFAKALGEQGLCIVSGLAFGIDAVAHKAALKTPGKTIAVLAHGIEQVTPRSHVSLAHEVLEAGGLLVSENLTTSPSFKSSYLIRNRLISGLSRGTLVIEAGLRSGALNTAKHALEQNRDVMAIPGRVTDLSSQGTNRLLARGAQVINTPKELVEWVGLEWQEARVEHQGLAFELVSALRENSLSMGELSELLLKKSVLKNPQEILPLLTKLELRGNIKKLANERYVLCEN